MAFWDLNKFQLLFISIKQEQWQYKYIVYNSKHIGSVEVTADSTFKPNYGGHIWVEDHHEPLKYLLCGHNISNCYICCVGCWMVNVESPG